MNEDTLLETPFPELSKDEAEDEDEDEDEDEAEPVVLIVFSSAAIV
ncbi:hypothetical protein [Argonema galeatum]|nr:hypothetical protein [Argonema galeatum]MCL1469029.1 hypothetical protein [Argonema galeatum A003/A1]